MMKYLKPTLVVLSSMFLFWVMFINYTDVHEVNIKRNHFSGETTLDSISGFNVSWPWVQTCSIDTRPIRICVTSSSRNFNCMLVSFNPNGWEEFIEMEGFYYYWWSNRISFNMGYDEEYRGMKDLIRGYSFDENQRTFIKIEKELQ